MPRKGHSKVSHAPNIKDQILDICVKLYNEHGVDNVSARLIAAELNISPGHITHFYPKREDIDAALVERVEHVIINDIKAFKAHEDADEMVQVQFHILNTLWKYRFLIQARRATRVSAVLRESFLRFERAAVATIEEEFRAAMERGQLRPATEASSVHWLAENAWSLWLVPLEHSPNGKRGPTSRRQVLRESAVRHFSLMQPYFKSQKLVLMISDAIDRQFGA